MIPGFFLSALYTHVFSCHTSRCQVQTAVNATIADLVAWSLDCASKGVAPGKGFYDEEFSQNMNRFHLKGKELANGWKNLDGWLYTFFFGGTPLRPICFKPLLKETVFVLGESCQCCRACYFAMKADLKARKWMHQFKRGYNCNLTLCFISLVWKLIYKTLQKNTVETSYFSVQVKNQVHPLLDKDVRQLSSSRWQVCYWSNELPESWYWSCLAFDNARSRYVSSNGPWLYISMGSSGRMAIRQHKLGLDAQFVSGDRQRPSGFCHSMHDWPKRFWAWRAGQYPWWCSQRNARNMFFSWVPGVEKWFYKGVHLIIKGQYFLMNRLFDSFTKGSHMQWNVLRKSGVPWRFYLPLKPILNTTSIGGLNEFAEMSSRYKASHIKLMIWWVARRTHEASEMFPNESCLMVSLVLFCFVFGVNKNDKPFFWDDFKRLCNKDAVLQVLATCCYGVQRMVEIMHEASIILEPSDAKEASECLFLHLKCFSWLAIFYSNT